MPKEKKKESKVKSDVIDILAAYNKFFERIFEQGIFTDKENKILKLIYQKLSEVSALIEDLNG
jgi:hypothetical protein